MKLPRFLNPQNNKEWARAIFLALLLMLTLAVIAEITVRLSPDILRDKVEREWLEWILFSLAGVCSYLLWNVAIWYKRSDSKFEKYAYWYAATVVRAPVLTLIVLLALTNISFTVSGGEGLIEPSPDQGVTAVEEQPAAEEEQPSAEEEQPVAEEEQPVAEEEQPVAEEEQPVAEEEPAADQEEKGFFDFGIDFENADENVLLIAAFLLGFYSRLTKDMLGRIARFIFGGVYEETYKEERRGMIKVEKVVGDLITEAKKKLEGQGLKPVVHGDPQEGNVLHQYPQAGEEVEENSFVVLSTDSEKPEQPAAESE